MALRRRVGKARSARYAREAVAPARSRRVYVRLRPQDMALFKFILEGHDNLAYLSVVDRYSAVCRLVHSPGQEREVREWLEAMRTQVDFAVIEP
ncbi:DUF4911 domain-containing protein [Desulfocurvus sp.]|jgi:hypothetical protein|uniref:DUF4911 domain-containing protein n=1 Tax=Desulfocurvus sp. TaxID=2871698 RepID=UPI0025B9ED76|nr:DUF4911 domain-containing protein [Desulfocurvus sp.]MCK9240507.1 DUF4911 domain-containing protein [Desulfocurvus sp.]